MCLYSLLHVAQQTARAPCPHWFFLTPKSYGSDAEVGPGRHCTHSEFVSEEGTLSLEQSQSIKGAASKFAYPPLKRETLSLVV